MNAAAWQRLTTMWAGRVDTYVNRAVPSDTSEAEDQAWRSSLGSYLSLRFSKVGGLFFFYEVREMIVPSVLRNSQWITLHN